MVMAWIAVSKNGTIIICDRPPSRLGDFWSAGYDPCVRLLKGSAEKLTGHPMTWEDLPRELKEE